MSTFLLSFDLVLALFTPLDISHISLVCSHVLWQPFEFYPFTCISYKHSYTLLLKHTLYYFACFLIVRCMFLLLTIVLVLLYMTSPFWGVKIKFVRENICLTFQFDQIQLYLQNSGIDQRWYSSVLHFLSLFIAKCGWTKSSRVLKCKQFTYKYLSIFF